MPPINAVVAGAAAAAAAERGAGEEEQFKQAVAAGMIAEAALPKQADVLEPARAPRAEKAAEHEHKKAEAQPKEGFLRKLAHWLNLM